MSSQEIKAGGHVLAAAGEGHVVSTGDLVFQQSWTRRPADRPPKLADDPAQLRAAMKQEATVTEHDVATRNISRAEKAAKAGDGPRRWSISKRPASGAGHRDQARDRRRVGRAHEGDRCRKVVIRWPDRAHFFV